jgi:hypothetical protein
MYVFLLFEKLQQLRGGYDPYWPKKQKKTSNNGAQMEKKRTQVPFLILCERGHAWMMEYCLLD